MSDRWKGENVKQFLNLMQLVFKLLGTEFTLYGYRFSYLSVIYLSLVFGVVCVVIRGLFSPD